MNEQILVVDDEPQIVRFLRSTLSGHGYGVSTAGDAAAASRCAASCARIRNGRSGRRSRS